MPDAPTQSAGRIGQRAPLTTRAASGPTTRGARPGATPGHGTHAPSPGGPRTPASPPEGPPPPCGRANATKGADAPASESYNGFAVDPDHLDELTDEQRAAWRHALLKKFGLSDDEAADAPLDRDQSCITGSLIGLDAAAGRVLIIPTSCGRWDCPYCSIRKARQYYARIFSQQPERKITLTLWPRLYRDPLHALEVGKKALPKLAHILRKGVKDGHGGYKVNPVQFEYAAVWEVHASGWPHLHIAQWGAFVDRLYLRKLWHRLTGSYNTDVREIVPHSHDGHNWVKYLLKSIPQTQSLFQGRRLVTFSARWKRYASPNDKAKADGRLVWQYFNSFPSDLAERLESVYNAAYSTDPDGEDVYTIQPILDHDDQLKFWFLLDGGNAHDWESFKAFNDPPPPAPPPPVERQSVLFDCHQRPV